MYFNSITKNCTFYYKFPIINGNLFVRFRRWCKLWTTCCVQRLYSHGRTWTVRSKLTLPPCYWMFWKKELSCWPTTCTGTISQTKLRALVRKQKMIFEISECKWMYDLMLRSHCQVFRCVLSTQRWTSRTCISPPRIMPVTAPSSFQPPPSNSTVAMVSNFYPSCSH